MLKGPCLVECQGGEEADQAKVKFSTLKQKWETLQLEAEQRLPLLAMAQFHVVQLFE